MKHVLEYLEKTESCYGDKVAVIEEHQSCTYQELLEQSKRIGSSLCAYYQKKQPIPILMEKGIACITAFFGSSYAGCFYVLLNPSLPKSRLEQMLEVLRVPFLVTDQEHMTLASQLHPSVLLVEELGKGPIETSLLEERRAHHLDVDPLYANFTSGSTGVPKAVVVSHRSVIDFIDRFTDRFGISACDIIGNQAPFDFDVSVKDLYSSIQSGATLVIIPKPLFSKPALLLDFICDQNITTFIWAVSALCLISTFHGLDYRVPTSVTKVLFSGEVMPIKQLKNWMEHLPQALFVNLYGPTEITCNCTYHIVDKKRMYDRLPIGISFDNEEVVLLNEKNERIEKCGQIGEICVRGSALSLGYYQDLEQTDKCFVQNPCQKGYRDWIYRTGDLGYQDSNGEFYFSGRKDFQIKYLGHRIELEEIETAIVSLAGVEHSCCIFDEEKGKLYGFYVGTLERQMVHQKLRETLPTFMIPTRICKLDQFPLTKNGKIDRKQLKKEGVR